jgi:hypothetical protein
MLEYVIKIVQDVIFHRSHLMLLQVHWNLGKELHGWWK